MEGALVDSVPLNRILSNELEKLYKSEVFFRLCLVVSLKDRLQIF